MQKLKNFVKDFRNWFSLKPQLDKQAKRLSFREREVWYCYWGTNIGFEIDGKNQNLRPCLVFKKLSCETFYALPLTSKIKNGTWYFPSKVQNKSWSVYF